MFSQILQVVIALGIINVWIFRFGQSTRYRGGNAKNLREEFEEYGLPLWFMVAIGIGKLTLAALLLAGLWYSWLTLPAAVGMSVLMAGAVAMHIKVGDPAIKAVPATLMLAMSLFVASINL